MQSLIATPSIFHFALIFIYKAMKRIRIRRLIYKRKKSFALRTDAGGQGLVK
jgi:hypothetical protein